MNLDKFEDFWEELGNAIVYLFSPEYGEYDNLNLGVNTLSNLRAAVIAFYLAIVIAAVVVCLNKNLYSALVIAINGQAAWSADKAMTLKELGLERNSAVRQGLRGRAYLGLVRCVEQDNYYEQKQLERQRFEEDEAAEGTGTAVFKLAAYKINFETDHFYIPEKDSIQAESRFERKGNGIIAAVISIVVAIACLILTMKFLPDIIMLFNNFVGILSENSTSY